MGGWVVGWSELYFLSLDKFLAVHFLRHLSLLLLLLLLMLLLSCLLNVVARYTSAQRALPHLVITATFILFEQDLESTFANIDLMLLLLLAKCGLWHWLSASRVLRL